VGVHFRALSKALEMNPDQVVAIKARTVDSQGAVARYLLWMMPR
jgi:hypothetical protein